MKRALLLTMAALAMATAANAQTRTGELPYASGGSFIPGEFTSTGSPYLAMYDDVNAVDEGEGHDNEIGYTNDINWTIYNKELQIVREIHTDFRVTGLTFLDITTWTEAYVCPTQTLFNNDAAFEFVVRHEDGFQVVSEDGSVLLTFPVDDGWRLYRYGEPEILIWEDKMYLTMTEVQGGEYDDWEDYKVIVFLLDRQTQSISRVEGELPFAVHPTMASRNEPITVELGERNSPTEVVVVDANGRVLKQVSVPAGQPEVRIPASELQSGLNIIHTRNRQGDGSRKIVVR